MVDPRVCFSDWGEVPDGAAVDEGVDWRIIGELASIAWMQATGKRFGAVHRVKGRCITSCSGYERIKYEQR
jgi:hypothetical protein